VTITHSRLSFWNTFYNWQSSRGPQEKLSRVACCLRAVCCAGLLYGMICSNQQSFIFGNNPMKSDLLVWIQKKTIFKSGGCFSERPYTFKRIMISQYNLLWFHLDVVKTHSDFTNLSTKTDDFTNAIIKKAKQHGICSQSSIWPEQALNFKVALQNADNSSMLWWFATRKYFELPSTGQRAKQLSNCN